MGPPPPRQQVAHGDNGDGGGGVDGGDGVQKVGYKYLRQIV